MHSSTDLGDCLPIERAIRKTGESTVDVLFKKTGHTLEKIRKAIQKLKRMGKHTFAFTKAFGDADYDFTVVKNGKGVHNVEYAEELIESVNMRLDQLEKRLAKGR